MGTKFNVFEVLQIAESIEHKGAKFYLRAAELFDNPELRDIYLKLANWKARHGKILAERRKQFSEKTGEFGTFDPDNYVLSNPHVMAGLTWFGTKIGSFKRLSGRESREEILKDAINRANELITFYHGLKDFARDPATEEAIEQVIQEENRHIRLISKQLKL